MEVFEGYKTGFELLWSVITADTLLTTILLLFFVGPLLLAFVTKLLRVKKLRRSGILEIDHMPGRTFEEYLQVLLKTRGYSVDLTPASGDYGADLILTAKGKKVVVQAKRYKKNVGVKAVQEVVSAKNHYHPGADVTSGWKMVWIESTITKSGDVLSIVMLISCKLVSE